MNGRLGAVRALGYLLVVVFVFVGSFGAICESVTYCGVTFPQGDLAFADRVVDYVAASCVRDAYDDPEEALGPPDARSPVNTCTSGCEGCDGCSTNAVSLGFRLSVLDNRGYLIVEFVDNILVDVAGPDLFVYITNGQPCRVEISADGFSYTFVGETVGYPGAIDIAPYIGGQGQYRFVRLSDVPADEDHSECPGPSIDAIGAMGPAIQIAEGEAFGSLELQPIGELAFAFEQIATTFYIILDSSSSMGEVIDGEVKLTIAKEVIVDLLQNLPNEAIVGVRTFGGHCSTNLLASVAPIDHAALRSEIQKLTPRGATPIALALDETYEDLNEISGQKLLLLVSDGIETCKGDPVASAKALIDSGLDLRIHVVGFDISRNMPARDQLIAIAKSTGGLYFDANNSAELRQAMSIAAPFSYTVFDESGNAVFEGRIGQDGPSLPAGVYTVVIDTNPLITMSNVVVKDQATTLITVEQENGGFHAEVDN